MRIWRPEDLRPNPPAGGLMAAGTKLPAYTEFPGGPNPMVPPDELLTLHKWLCELDFPNSKEWTPKYVEVMLWDYFAKLREQRAVQED